MKSNNNEVTKLRSCCINYFSRKRKEEEEEGRKKKKRRRRNHELVIGAGRVGGDRFGSSQVVVMPLSRGSLRSLGVVGKDAAGARGAAIPVAYGAVATRTR